MKAIRALPFFILSFVSVHARDARAEGCESNETEVRRVETQTTLDIWCVADGDLEEHRKNAARLSGMLARQADVAGRIAALDATLSRERAALEKTTIDLGAIEQDCEAWVDLTAEARKASNEAALNVLATILLARVDNIGKQKNALAKKQLDELYEEYQGSILSTLATRNAQQAGIVAPVHQWKNTQEFLGDLKKLTSIASATDTGSKGDYWRAIAKLSSIALKDPKAKVLVADFDFMIAAVYKNGASWTAKARVDQLLALSDAGLKGVKSFSEVYRTHVLDRKKLKLEGEALTVEKKTLEERQRALEGS